MSAIQIQATHCQKMVQTAHISEPTQLMVNMKRNVSVMGNLLHTSMQMRKAHNLIDRLR